MTSVQDFSFFFGNGSSGQWIRCSTEETRRVVCVLLSTHLIQSGHPYNEGPPITSPPIMHDGVLFLVPPCISQLNHTLCCVQVTFLMQAWCSVWKPCPHCVLMVYTPHLAAERRVIFRKCLKKTYALISTTSKTLWHSARGQQHLLYTKVNISISSKIPTPNNYSHASAISCKTPSASV